MVRRFLRALLNEDRGQDLAEYCLLTALVALVGLGIFLHFSGGLQAIWNDANTSLANGSAATTPSSGAASSPTGH